MGEAVAVEKSEEASKLAKYLGDQTWRMNNLYCVEPEAGGIVKFRMRPVQAKFWRDMWWLNVILKSRQHGMSTEILLHITDTAIFNANITCGIIDKSLPDATKKLNKIKLAFDNLDNPAVHPDTYKIGAFIKAGITIVKSNSTDIEFSNGSKIWVGVDLRGGTVQYLHISELGFIAYNDAERAKRIRAGALNTVHQGCKVTIESTHEGGRAGLNYEMVRLAQASPAHLSALHWKFHFYGWHEDPKNYTEPDAGYRFTVTEFFEQLYAKKEAQLGIKLSKGQRYWYALKYATQKEDMSKEHPFDAEEALTASVKGAIYGSQLGKLRADGRVCNFELDAQAPLFTFWDLGSTDYTWILLMQLVGLDWHIYKTFADHGQGARFYYAKILEWERLHGPISWHYLPHDAKNNVRGKNSSWMDDFKACGMRNLKRVIRTSDKWKGIRHGRTQFQRLYIHATNCDENYDMKEFVIPSLLSCFEAYHTKMDEKNGMLKEVPDHDQFSHGADSYRTFAEAHMRGMIAGGIERNMDDLDAQETNIKRYAAQRRPRVVVNRLHGGDGRRSRVRY